MKVKVSEHEKGIDISVEDAQNKKEKLLEAFKECQEGRCSCPTEEYKKLKSLDIEHDDQEIRLHLQSRQGQKLNKIEIDKCLEYTSRRVEEKTNNSN